jgi:hypothetical protein
MGSISGGNGGSLLEVIDGDSDLHRPAAQTSLDLAPLL